MKIALTIAGFDPSSGAGVTSDLMVFAAHGLFGTSCITALTVQSTLGVRSTHPVAAEIVTDTLDFLHDDLPPAGIKIGMVGSTRNALSIMDYLAISEALPAETALQVNRPIVVLDPVVRSSSGRELIDETGMNLLRKRLLGLVDWVTPNLEELELLSGILVRNPEDIVEACKELQAGTFRPGYRGPLGILATGGNRDPPDDLMFTPDGEVIWLRGESVKTNATHGTGCAFSSAFLCELVAGKIPEEAARRAKRYVSAALRTAPIIGHGAGPINHLWPLVDPKD